MRRREFITLIGGMAAAWPLAARAQPAPKTHFVLWVSTEAQPDPFIDGFREGMREHRYVEGQNLAFVLRYAPGDPARLRAMLPELVSVPADLIVSSGPAILAMRAATGKPVLFAISGDPKSSSAEPPPLPALRPFSLTPISTPTTPSTIATLSFPNPQLSRFATPHSITRFPQPPLPPSPSASLTFRSLQVRNSTALCSAFPIPAPTPCWSFPMA